jgi:hypothetical protein
MFEEITGSSRREAESREGMMAVAVVPALVIKRFVHSLLATT